MRIKPQDNLLLHMQRKVVDGESLSAVYIHLVFSTKDRHPLLRDKPTHDAPLARSSRSGMNRLCGLAATCAGCSALISRRKRCTVCFEKAGNGGQTLTLPGACLLQPIFFKPFSRLNLEHRGWVDFF